MMQECCSNVVGMLQECCRNVVGMLQKLQKMQKGHVMLQKGEGGRWWEGGREGGGWEARRKGCLPALAMTRSNFNSFSQEIINCFIFFASLTSITFEITLEDPKDSHLDATLWSRSLLRPVRTREDSLWVLCGRKLCMWTVQDVYEMEGTLCCELKSQRFTYSTGGSCYKD